MENGTGEALERATQAEVERIMTSEDVTRTLPAPPPLRPLPVEAMPSPILDPSQVNTAAPIPTVVTPMSEAEVDATVKKQIEKVDAADRASRPVLTEVQRLQIEAAEWRWKAMKAKTALAEEVANKAANAEAAAYESLMATCRAAGVDTDRDFRIDAKGRITYPMGGRISKPDYAPPEGSTVKR